MKKADILAARGDLRTGASPSVGIGSEVLNLTSDVTWGESDNVPFELRVVADGDVKFTGVSGMTDTWEDCVAGDVIPIAVVKVFSTSNGTTATVRAVY